MAVLIIDCYIGLFGTCFMQVLYLGRAPRTNETLPDFCEKCPVTRHSRVFRGLTGSQRTPGFGASQKKTWETIPTLEAILAWEVTLPGEQLHVYQVSFLDFFFI